MKKIWTYVLKAPLIVFAAISFLVSIYAAAANIEDISWFSPIFLGLLLALYGFGAYSNRWTEQ